MKRLHALIGAEHDLSEVCRELHAVVRSLSPATVGALHITCSDESEHECTEAFQRVFAQESLPRLKYGSRVPFRVANPGARYEWGSAAIAEEHFATPASARSFKVLVAKINGHVSVTRSGGELCFGSMARYGSESSYCGAVHALLGGVDLPFVAALREAMQTEERDRLAVLQDDAQVDPALRALWGSILNARLQARFLVQDIQDHTPASPTLYLVLHGVTLNKPGPDTELLGGLYVIDRRGEARQDRYRGLGDDPARYVLDTHAGSLRVSDPDMETERDARDHRRLARERLAAWREQAATALPAAQRVIAQVQAGDAGHGRRALERMLQGLLAVAPVPAALVLAAEGLAAAHHLQRLGQSGSEEARRARAGEVIDAVRARLDRLPDGRAAHLVGTLREAFRAASPDAP